MSVKGLGNICFLISDCSEQFEWIINIINRIAEKIYHAVVIVNDDNHEIAQKKFSYKVEIYNISMNQNKLGKATFRSFLSIIQPSAVLVVKNDTIAIGFAEYSREPIKKLAYKDGVYVDDVLYNGNEDEIASSIITNVEKQCHVDCYAKYYAQQKAFGAYMTFNEFLVQVFCHRQRVEHSFVKSWGYELPKEPKTYNEKLNWLKIYGRTQRFRHLADKYKARKWLSKNGYNSLLPVCYAVERKHISKKTWEELPDKFVIKPSNSSGYNIVITSKANADLEVLNRVLECVMRVKYGALKHEPVYSLSGKILLMKYMDNLTDYKFFCFNGRVEFIAVVKEWLKENGSKEPYQIILNRDYEEMPFSYGYERGPITYEKPHYFDEMLEVVENLSKSVPHVRLDMMGDNDSYYFGEFTFFPGGGRDRFNPSDYDLIMGQKLDLSKY